MFFIEKRETTSEIKMSLKAGLGKERIDVEKLSKISLIPFICLMSKVGSPQNCDRIISENC